MMATLKNKAGLGFYSSPAHNDIAQSLVNTGVSQTPDAFFDIERSKRENRF